MIGFSSPYVPIRRPREATPDEKEDLISYISIVPIDKLYIHEMIIESEKRRIKKLIERAGTVWAPLPVARADEGWVIMDGMHRRAALKEMGVRYVPVFTVGYEEFRVGSKTYKVDLKCWHRVLGGEFDVDEFRKAIRGKFEEVKGRVGERAFAALLTDNERLALGPAGSILEMNRRLGELEVLLESLGYVLEPDPLKRSSLRRWMWFELEERALNMLRSGEIKAVLEVPRLKPEDVISVAVSASNDQDKVFIRKTTRHVIPMRPFNVEVPLSQLDRDVTEEVRSKLRGMRMWVWDSGVMLDRYYNEPVAIFGESNWIQGVERVMNGRLSHVTEEGGEKVYHFVRSPF